MSSLLCSAETDLNAYPRNDVVGSVWESVDGLDASVLSFNQNQQKQQRIRRRCKTRFTVVFATVEGLPSEEPMCPFHVDARALKGEHTGKWKVFKATLDHVCSMNNENKRQRNYSSAKLEAAHVNLGCVVLPPKNVGGGADAYIASAKNAGVYIGRSQAQRAVQRKRRLQSTV